MPTYTLYSETADGDLYGQSVAYANARSTVTDLLSGNSQTYFTFGQDFATPFYYVYESFISFDTSSVVGTPLSVTLSLYYFNDQTTTDFTMEARASNWGSSLSTVDWVAGADLSALPLRASLSTSGLSTGQYVSFTSDSSFVSNLTNPVRLVLCSANTTNNTAPTGREYAGFRSGDMTPQATYAPKLEIVTLGSATPTARRRPSGLYVR